MTLNPTRPCFCHLRLVLCGGPLWGAAETDNVFSRPLPAPYCGACCGQGDVDGPLAMCWRRRAQRLHPAPTSAPAPHPPVLLLRVRRPRPPWVEKMQIFMQTEGEASWVNLPRVSHRVKENVVHIVVDEVEGRGRAEQLLQSVLDIFLIFPGGGGGAEDWGWGRRGRGGCVENAPRPIRVRDGGRGRLVKEHVVTELGEEA